MKKRSFWLVLIIVGLALALPKVVLATPDAPRVVINPSTQECDPVFYWRDECGEAVLPPGWEYSTENACPAGYKTTDLTAEWKKYQTEFCCQSRGGDYCLPSVLTPPFTPESIIKPTPAPAARTFHPVLLLIVTGCICIAGILVLCVLLFLIFRRKS